MNTEKPGPQKPGMMYGEYLKVSELLELQRRLSEPPHHDEMLFIIIHQAYELWFKLILHELETAVSQMQQQKVLRARHFVERVVKVMHVLVDQIHILETMTPVEFLGFRDRLTPASGFQSAQFREIEFIGGLKDERYFSMLKSSPEILQKLRTRFEAPDLWQSYVGLLLKLGHPVSLTDPELTLKALVQIYQDPEKNLPLYLLSESLLEFDEYLILFRTHHVRVVERVIGMKRGTGGSSGVEYLKTTLDKKCFPLLWDVRAFLEKQS